MLVHYTPNNLSPSSIHRDFLFLTASFKNGQCYSMRNALNVLTLLSCLKGILPGILKCVVVDNRAFVSTITLFVEPSYGLSNGISGFLNVSVDEKR